MDLFPVPTTPKHHLAPRRLPGATLESTDTLQKVLLENHEKWHAMYNDFGFHNHVAHHAIVLWALGSSPEVIQRAYAAEINGQRPIDYGVTDDVVPITEENFSDHLGEQRYYQAYLAFFSSQFASLGPTELITKYLFSPQFNTPMATMLNRSLAAIAHGFIHVGYGLEFGLPGMVIEGLAMSAVTKADPAGDLYTSLIPSTKPSSSLLSIALSSLSLADQAQRTSLPGPSAHALSFLSRIDADPVFATERTFFMKPKLYSKYGDKLKEFAREWIREAAQQGCHDEAWLQKLLESKMEELAWMNVVIYAAGGFSEGNFMADFFTMHLVTSSLFLPSYLSALHSHHQAALSLLQGFFITSVLWHIIRRGGKPLDLAGFYRHTESYVSRENIGEPLIPQASNERANVQESDLNHKAPGITWSSIVSSSLESEDEHYPKIQRALMHYAVMYGTKRFDDIAPGISNPSMKAFEELDGTLFWRAAAATEERVGRRNGLHKNGGVDLFWDGRPKEL